MVTLYTSDRFWSYNVNSPNDSQLPAQLDVFAMEQETQIESSNDPDWMKTCTYDMKITQKILGILTGMMDVTDHAH